MIRLGGNRDFSYIADYLRRLLHAPQPTLAQQQEFNSAKQRYERLLSDKARIIKQQEQVIQSSNQLTRMNLEIASIKEKWNGWQNICNPKTEKRFISQLKELSQSWDASRKEKQSFWTKLIWIFIKKDRQRIFKSSLVSYNSLQKEIKRQEIDAEQFDDSILSEQENAIKEYRQRLEFKYEIERIRNAKQK